MSLVSVGLEAAKKLTPPKYGDDPTVWRWAVVAILAIFVLHIAWACSLLPGIPGFATAAETQKIQEGQAAIIYGQILELRVRQCAAIDAKRSSELLKAYAKQMSDLKAAYRGLTATEADIPTCSDLRGEANG